MKKIGCVMNCFSDNELRRNLSLLPESVGATMIMRHSIRDEIPEGDAFGFDIFLTEEGEQRAESLGKIVEHPISYVASSPLYRCIRTAELFTNGRELEVVREERIGALSAYVFDTDLAAEFIHLHGGEGMVNWLLSGDVPPGMNPIEDGEKVMMDMLRSRQPKSGELHLYLTHDTVLSLFVYRMLGKTTISKADWPKVLESCLVWFDDSSVNFIWRGEKHTVSIAK